MDDKINEAYMKIAEYRSQMPGQFGIGIDWESEANVGLHRRKLSVYQRTLKKAKNDSDLKAASCYVLCDMVGCPHRINQLIKRILGSVSNEFIEHIEEENELNVLKQEVREQIREYKKDEYKQYEIYAALDLSTCSLCREMDGRVFNLADARIGVNCPPFHTGCRCVISPCIPGLKNSGDTRAVRDPKTGKNISVPNMSYTEWYRRYVKDL